MAFMYVYIFSVQIEFDKSNDFDLPFSIQIESKYIVILKTILYPRKFY